MLGRSFKRRTRTRRTAAHDAARQRLAMLGVQLAGEAPVESPDRPPDAVGAATKPDEAWPPPDELRPTDESGPPDEPVPTDALARTVELEPTNAPAPAVVAGPGRHAARPLGTGARLRAALADRLSPSVRSAMDGSFSGHHLGVLAIVLAAGLAITAWWVLSGRPEEQSVPAVSFGSPTAEPPASDEAAASAPPSSSGTPTDGDGEVVVVDVAGKVRKPGIVTLPVGSRVVDALEAAGGARPGVDLADLNLARILVDGEQLLVGLAPAVVPTTPGASGTPTAIGGLVNINTADLAELDTLPGVGPVTAQAILDWRAENGSFTTVDELIEVDGIGEVTLAELRDLVTV